MTKKWNPLESTNVTLEIDKKILDQRLAELAKVFYDIFCELPKTFSVEPANTNDSCIEQDHRKAG